MRLLSLAAIATMLAVSSVSAASITFSSGGSFVLFQTTDGNPLDNGRLHAGYFASDPTGLSTADLQSNFVTWATFGDSSNVSGFFGNGAFPDISLGGAAGRDIYLVATNSESVSTASQIAVFTNTSDSEWSFAASDDISFDPSISLDDVVDNTAGASILAGTEVTSPLTSGPAIRLTAVPEPSTFILSILGILSLTIKRRRK